MLHIIHISVPTDILTMNISQEGSARAGEIYRLKCSVQKIKNGLFHNPNATWFVSGEPVQERDGINISSPEASISILTFNPLKTSHARNYSCRGALISLAPPQHFSILDYHLLRVQSELLSAK